MSAFNVRPGSLTAVYTTEDVPVGTLAVDPQNQKKYIFVKNYGTTAIAASDVCTSLGTQVAAFGVQTTDAACLPGLSHQPARSR